MVRDKCIVFMISYFEVNSIVTSPYVVRRRSFAVDVISAGDVSSMSIDGGGIFL